MDNFSFLLKRFLSAEKNDLISFFDVDEIISLINFFLEKDDIVNLKAAIELGNELHPDDINIKIALCQALVSIEDYYTAIKIIEDNNIKGNKDIDLMRLECYCELDRYEEAVLLIDDLTEKNSDYLEDAIIHMASTLNDLEAFQEKAYGFIKNKLALYPDNFYLRTELCFNLEVRGQTKEALDLCRKLIAKNPYSAEVWYMQGRLYSICADFEKAIDAFDFALTCIEDNNEMEYEIKIIKAFCLQKNGSYDKAIDCYKELISYEEFENSYIDPYLAECYMDIKEYGKAYDLLIKAINSDIIDDDKVSVYGNLIYCCIETERRDEAINILGDALKLFPHSIIEYISSLNITNNRPTNKLSGKESVVYPSELVRNYYNSNIHYN